MKTINQTRLDKDVADTPSIPALSQVDELRAAEMLSHGFENTELAEAGRRARRLAAAKCFRADLVQRLRREIAAGTYPDDDQLSVAVKGLCRALVRNVECTLERKAAG
jgi:hypothetical protein